MFSPMVNIMERLNQARWAPFLQVFEGTVISFYSSYCNKNVAFIYSVTFCEKKIKDCLPHPVSSIATNYCSLNPLSPNSDQHQFSPNNIHTMSRDQVKRIN